jgi:hypothetical protein
LAKRVALLGLFGLSAACEPEPCGPTDPDPLCNNITGVSIVSPVDTVMAVGFSVQMEATGHDPDGAPVEGAEFNWSSTTPGTATVGAGTGFVTAVAAGTTQVRAAASGSEAVGTINMRAVNADLNEIESLIDDPFFEALRGGLTGAVTTNLDSAFALCATALSAGHVRAVDQCITTALGATPGSANNTALMGVMALYLRYARTQLDLD